MEAVRKVGAALLISSAVVAMTIAAVGMRVGTVPAGMALVPLLGIPGLGGAWLLQRGRATRRSGDALLIAEAVLVAISLVTILIQWYGAAVGSGAGFAGWILTLVLCPLATLLGTLCLLALGLAWDWRQVRSIPAAGAGETGFYFAGGTLKADAPSYVVRQADLDLHACLRRGEFCYLFTSRQMGKSSLMIRTAARLRQEGIAVAVLDLTAIGQNISAEQWYEGLLGRLGRQLDLEDELEEFWMGRERLGPLERWMEALREVVLPAVGVRCQVLGVREGDRSDPSVPNTQHPTPNTSRLVIFIDEIDAVRSLAFSTDEFFAGIRQCYNRRAEDPEYQRLTFCLLGVATPADLIRDPRTTPFNIGRRIELTDFTAAEAAPMAKGLGRPEPLAGMLLQQVLSWTDGHPYLTQRLCGAVAADPRVTDAAGVDRLCQALFLAPGARERDDNLLFVRERLLRQAGPSGPEADLAGLLDLYGQVHSHKLVPADETSPLVEILRLSGITRVVGGYLRVRNRIYYRVFDQEWVTSHMPDVELRRQRTAFRRGVRAALTIAGVVVVLGWQAFWMIRSWNQLAHLPKLAPIVAPASLRPNAAGSGLESSGPADSDLQLGCTRALAQLAFNDAAGYRRTCAALLDRFGTSQNPGVARVVAWTCALAPGAATDVEQPVQLAETAVAGLPGDHEALHTLGAALYRAGRWEAAVRRLNQAVAAQPPHGSTADALLLAMSYRRLGRPQEAGQWLDRARRSLETRQPPGEELTLEQRGELQLLRREAEALLETRPPGR